MICDVLNCRTSGEGFQTWTTDGHPPSGGCDGVHIGYAHKLVFHNTTRTHTRDPRGCQQSDGHDTYWCFEVHLYKFWSMQTSCYSREAMWWGCQLHEHQGLCQQRGLRWSRGPQRGDWWLYGYHLGELARSHLQPWGPGWLRDIPGSHHWLGWVQHLLPSHKLWGSPLQYWLRHAVCLGEVSSTRGLWTFLLFFLAESQPPKDLFISEGEVPFHLPPQLQNTSC